MSESTIARRVEAAGCPSPPRTLSIFGQEHFNMAGKYMRYSQKRKTVETTPNKTTTAVHLALNPGISVLFVSLHSLYWRTDGAIHIPFHQNVSMTVIALHCSELH